MSIINAQNRKILGYVLSNQTNTPIENVNIFINDQGIGTSSKSDGYFSLEKIPDSDFELSFSIIGFQDTSVFVTSKDNQINIGKFYLELSVNGFEEINVAAHPELGYTESLSNISLSGSEIQEKMKSTLLYKTILTSYFPLKPLETTPIIFFTDKAISLTTCSLTTP